MDSGSGVGVLDKAALVLSILESGPASLAGLVTATGLPRPTAHRVAVALEHHRLVSRDHYGRFALGPRLAELSAAANDDRLVRLANPILTRLRDITGEAAYLFRRSNNVVVCAEAVFRTQGSCDQFGIGTTLPIRAGSAAQVLLAWENTEVLATLGEIPARNLLLQTRRLGFAQTTCERDDIASISAPVRKSDGTVVAAVSIAGPVARVTAASKNHAPAVVAAANALTERIRRRR